MRWPPGFELAGACQPSMASSENQSVSSPRLHSAVSYSRQLRTRYGFLVYLYWLRLG